MNFVNCVSKFLTWFGPKGYSRPSANTLLIMSTTKSVQYTVVFKVAPAWWAENELRLFETGLKMCVM